jgi:hypothetical protein
VECLLVVPEMNSTFLDLEDPYTLFDFYQGRIRKDKVSCGCIVPFDNVAELTKEAISWKYNKVEYKLDAQEFKQLCMPQQDEIFRTYENYRQKHDVRGMEMISILRSEADSLKWAACDDDVKAAMLETWNDSSGPRMQARVLQEMYGFSNRQVYEFIEFGEIPKRKRRRRQTYDDDD